MKITETALKFKTTVYALIVFIIVVGALSYRSLPLEASPEVKIPIISFRRSTLASPPKTWNGW